MDELKSLIEQNTQNMKSLKLKIQAATASLGAIVDDGQVGGYDFDSWTRGHVGKMVAEMSGLIMRQRALLEAEHIASKNKNVTEG